MVDDPRDPLPDVIPRPPDPPARASRNTSCGFCGCTLGPDGEYLKLSERARGLRDLEETLEKERREAAKVAAELADLKRANAERDGKRTTARDLLI